MLEPELGAAAFDALLRAVHRGVVLVFDEDLRYVAGGGTGLPVIGIEPHEVVGKRASEVFGERTGRVAEERMRRCLVGESVTATADLRHWAYEIRYEPIHRSDGSVRGGLAYVVDLTRQKDLELRSATAESRYRRLIESFPGACFLFDAEGRYLAAGGRTLSDMGMEPKALVGHMPEEVLGDEAGGFIRGLADRARAGELVVTDVPGPDGAIYALRFIRVDASGEVVATASDVTETRARTSRDHARHDALLREVHHRVKNHLQVVASLLSVSARHASADEAREALRTVRTRVRSMAAVHAELYRYSDSDPERLDAFLKRLLAHLRRSLPGVGAAALKHTLDPIRVPAGLATTIGLLVVELVTNAAEHAYPDGARGTIDVRATLEPDAVVLRIEDDGVGLSLHEGEASSPTDHLGLWLVRTLVTARDGELSVDTSARGTRWYVRMPLGADEEVSLADA